VESYLLYLPHLKKWLTIIGISTTSVELETGNPQS